MLKQRLITALVLAPATLGCVFFLNSGAFAVFVSLVIMIAAWEWGPLMGLDGNSGRIGFMAVTAILMAALHWFSPVIEMWSGGSLAGVYQYILIVAALWWVLATVLICSYPKSSAGWQHSLPVKGVFGLLTLIPAWIAFIAIRTIDIESQFYFGATLLFVSLVIVWAADVGAYFFGKKFGKHKLMPNVSPNKTVEGFLGGLLTVALLILILNMGFGVALAHYPAYFVVAIITAVVSAIGDLNESMLKRVAGVKDSGSILPGHGGLLDRIDSLVAATPVFILMYLFFLR